MGPPLRLRQQARRKEISAFLCAHLQLAMAARFRLPNSAARLRDPVLPEIILP